MAQVWRNILKLRNQTQPTASPVLSALKIGARAQAEMKDLSVPEKYIPRYPPTHSLCHVRY
eukprot:918966-Rhodomonas_salina.1